MPCLKPQPPARRPSGSSAMFDSRRGARDGIGKKMVAVAPVELSKPDPRLLLGKRLRDEMEALRGLVKKAELLVAKNGNGGAPPDRFGGRRFMEAETRCHDTTEGERTPCAKKRKTMSVVNIVESKISVSKSKAANLGATPRHAKEGRRSMEMEARQESTEDEPKVAFIKKRKTMPPLEIDEPRTPWKREAANLATCVSSISPKTPARVEKEAANVTRSPVSRPAARQLEEGEIVEEEMDDDAFVDICGGVSPVPAVHASSSILPEDNKIEEENALVDTCGEASPVPTQKIAEAGNSPSSSSSSGSSCSGSSDSESSGSSDSDNSDSDDDDTESVGSSPAPDLPHKVDSPVAVVAHKVIRSSPCLREDQLIEEGKRGGASPVAAEQFVDESADYDEKSVGSSPFPSFLPKRNEEPAKPVERRQAEAQSEKSVPAPAPQMSHLLARARTRMRQLRREPERQKAYEELEAMERNALPSDWIRPMDMIEFGITAVEHLVTFERLVPGCGGPVQQWFGLSWKGE